MKPEDRELPKFAGGGAPKGNVVDFEELQVRQDKGPRFPMRPDKIPSNLAPDKLRDCVLPEYNGVSDEHVLGGKVTAQEALDLYKAHYAKVAEEQGLAPQEIEEVSPAEIGIGLGKRIIWLPVLWSRGQMLRMLKGEKARLTREVHQLLDVNAGLRALVSRQTEFIEAAEKLIFDLTRRPWWKFWR